MSIANPMMDPRPSRMFTWMRDKYSLSILTYEFSDLIGIDKNFRVFSNECVRDMSLKSRLFRATKCNVKKYFLHLFINNVVFYSLDKKLGLNTQEENIWKNIPNYQNLISLLKNEDYDLIVCMDALLIPLAIHAKGPSSKVLIDAREFYARNYDDQWRFRIFSKPLFDHICRKYLPLCDKIITVSPGLRQGYREEYGVESEVIMSLPNYYELTPSFVDSKHIRIIHHGLPSPSRHTEMMIEMMDYVDERFSLDLMLIPNESDYWKMLIDMANARKNVNIIPPVKMENIVPFTQPYDIGLFLHKPSNFNLTYTLPNKLFEFIQARLAVAIGPGIEMKKIVEKYNCGIVSPDFEPISMAECLNRLTTDEIVRLKNNSDEAARQLNESVNKIRIHSIIDELCNN